ncbi:MAG: hypothetical protein IK152_02665 [Lachnospiraceae bacterium]|nr:hypothetical protein [Lachnospiraceae bacterium]
MKKALYVLIQCTWGIPQTLLGFVLFLINIRRRHFFYHGAIVTEIPGRGSVSLGLFVFIGTVLPTDLRTKHRIPDEEMEQRVLVHEYGHTIQSLVLGPLYLPVIGIPSVTWCTIKFTLGKGGKRSYYRFYTERWANYLGEKATNKRAMGYAVV